MRFPLLDQAVTLLRGNVKGVSASGAQSYNSGSKSAGASWNQTIAMPKGGFKHGMMLICSNITGAGGGYSGGVWVCFDNSTTTAMSADNVAGTYANFYAKVASSSILTGPYYGSAASTIEITNIYLNTAGDTITIAWHNTAATSKTAVAYQKWHVWQ